MSVLSLDPSPPALPPLKTYSRLLDRRGQDSRRSNWSSRSARPKKLLEWTRSPFLDTRGMLGDREPAELQLLAALAALAALPGRVRLSSSSLLVGTSTLMAKPLRLAERRGRAAAAAAFSASFISFLATVSTFG